MMSSPARRVRKGVPCGRGGLANKSGRYFMPPKYDLAIIMRPPGVGGAERHTAELANYLAAAGLRTVLLQSGFDLRALGLQEIPGQLDVVATNLPLRGLSKADLAAWSALLSTYAAQRMLVVKTWYLDLDFDLIKLIRKTSPVVFHFEHSLPPQIGPRTSRRHFGFLPGLGLWWYKERFRRWRMGRMVDRVFVDSETARQELLEHALLAPDRIVACTNGVDVNRWTPEESKALAFRQQYGIPRDHYLFGVAGRVAPLKGIDLAVRAFDQLRRRVNGITLCIAGDGPARPDLQKLAGELGLEGFIRFTGYVDDISAAYSAMDTLLLPSLLESCPLALLEGMACGCRIIASPVGGIPELLGDPVCGDLAPTRDPDDWANLMQRHLNTPAHERPVLAARVRQFVTATHNQERQFRFLAEQIGASSCPFAGSARATPAKEVDRQEKVLSEIWI
jgi:glycosyltransferase involved in cell wall biosynthesis